MSGYSGKYIVKNPNKYKGDYKNVYYRSLWELKMMKKLDMSSGVIQWNSEEEIVRYISPIDGRQHRYFIDFWVKKIGSDGKISEQLIEVKPYAQTIEPTVKKRKTQRYIREVKTYGVNQAKWESARTYAKYNEMQFIVMTEKGIWLDEHTFKRTSRDIF